MRIALVVYRDDPSAGGSLRVGQLLAQYLPRLGVQAQLVVAYGPPGQIGATLPVRPQYLDAGSAMDRRAWFSTRRWFTTQRFDLVHFIDPVNWIHAATLGLPSKRVEHYHGRPIPETMSKRNNLLGILKRWTSNAAIAISEGAKQTAVRIGWMPADRVHVVYNGVDVTHFQERPTAAQARKQLGLPADVLLGGMVARLTEGNGVLEVVKVLERLPHHWHLVLVGDGPLRSAVEEQTRTANLSHRLHFTGALSDVRPAYAALDTVLFLARYQPFCLMLAEAMLCRVPIVGLQGAGEYTEAAYPLITRENAKLIPRQNPWDWNSVEPAESYDKVASAMVEAGSRSPAVLAQVDTAESWVATRFTAEQQAFHTMQAYTSILRTASRS